MYEGGGDENSIALDPGPELYELDAWDEALTCDADGCTIEAWFADQLRADTELLLDDDIAVAPYQSPAGAAGYQFVEVGPDSLAAALGFEAGEIVWSVAGLPLETLDDVVEAYRRLDSETSVTVELERADGRLVERRFELRGG